MILVLISLLVFHAPDGREIIINPVLITSMHAAKPDEPNKLYVQGTNCLISLVDGKNITVTETCDQVWEAIRKARQ